MMMRRNIITIRESGMVTIPSGVIRMSVNEIALLFEVMVPTVRGKIKALLKSRMCVESSGGIVRSNRVIPEYFGMEVVIAAAFQVDSYKADIFRRWVLRKLAQPTKQIYININEVQDGTLN